MFAIIGIVIVFGAVLGGYLMECPDTACGVAHHSRGRGGHHPDRKSAAYPQADCGGNCRSIQRVKLYQTTLSRFPEAVLRPVE